MFPPPPASRFMNPPPPPPAGRWFQLRFSRTGAPELLLLRLTVSPRLVRLTGPAFAVETGALRRLGRRDRRVGRFVVEIGAASGAGSAFFGRLL